ncbi:MAG: transporter substrate-binding domain-containing protein [Rhodobacterales bacterium]|nr:transporter substrate-binding domain-containing protein [Rhodobacterales bacterium]
MVRLVLPFLALLAALALPPPGARADAPLRLMTEEFAPYQFYEGQGDSRHVTGISIEIVQAIQQRLGDASPIKVLPWSRALKLLAKDAGSALFSTARTPEREDRFKWVGPLAPLEIVFFRRVGGGPEIHTLEEAKAVPRIGVTRNVATQEVLTNMGFSNLDVLQSGADEKNLTRLVKGRIDVWPTAYFAGIYSARKMGLLDRVEAVPGLSLMTGHLFIAFNRETDDGTIGQWQTALDQLKAEGVVDAILRKYDK